MISSSIQIHSHHYLGSAEQKIIKRPDHLFSIKCFCFIDSNGVQYVASLITNYTQD